MAFSSKALLLIVCVAGFCSCCTAELRVPSRKLLGWSWRGNSAVGSSDCSSSSIFASSCRTAADVEADDDSSRAATGSLSETLFTSAHAEGDARADGDHTFAASESRTGTDDHGSGAISESVAYAKDGHRDDDDDDDDDDH